MSGPDDTEGRPSLRVTTATDEADEAAQQFHRMVADAGHKAEKQAAADERYQAALHRLKAMHVTANREILISAGYGFGLGMALFGIWYFLFGRAR